VGSGRVQVRRHVRVVAVIRDDTSELLEHDEIRPCSVGDRVVIAGRADHLREPRRHLLG
jgi:hypothetical protein